MRIRLAGFLLVGFIGFILSFWVFGPVLSLRIYKTISYPVTLAAYSLFGYGLFKSFYEYPSESVRLSVSNVGIVLLFLVVSSVFLFQGPWSLITVADEPVLVGISQGLHMNRLPLVGMKAYEFEGTFTVLESYLDKRPIPFPTLLSILHDLTGYRLSNAYVLNAFLGLGYVALSGVLGFRLNKVTGAYIGILSAGSLPVLQYYSHGGGFDVFHVTLLLVVLLSALRWLRLGDDGSFYAFVFAGVLLCQSRYEAAYYAVPIGMIILFKWSKDQKINIPWLLYLVPLMFMLIPLHQHVFELNSGFWELDAKDTEQIFGFRYFYPNLAAAIRYFFDFTERFPNSPYITILGILAFVLVLAKGIGGIKKKEKWEEEVWIWLLFSAGLLVHFVLMMLYFYGQFDSGMLHRFSLPTYTLALLLIQVALKVSGGELFKRMILGVIAVGFVFYSIPVMSKSFYYNDSYPSIKEKWIDCFVERHKGERYLIIDRSPVNWIIRNISAVSYGGANSSISKIKWQLNETYFDAVYIVGLWREDVEDGSSRFMGKTAPSDRFEVDVIEQQKIHPFVEVKVGKVLSVKDSELTETSEKANSPENLNKKDIESLLSEFAGKKEFYENLP